MSGRNRTEIINTLGVAIPTSHRWPMGDEGKQAMLQGGVSGPPPYPTPYFNAHPHPIHDVSLPGMARRTSTSTKNRTHQQHPHSNTHTHVIGRLSANNRPRVIRVIRVIRIIRVIRVIRVIWFITDLGRREAIGRPSQRCFHVSPVGVISGYFGFPDTSTQTQ